MEKMKDLLALRTIEDGTPRVVLWRDRDEWIRYRQVSDPVVHINLAKRNRVMILAPLDANTLAKIVHGEANNLLTCVARAWYWDFDETAAAGAAGLPIPRAVVVAPAMNTYMWCKRTTQSHIRTVKEMGATIVPPKKKQLACGDVGVGAMADVGEIVEAALGVLSSGEDHTRCFGK